MKCERCKKEIKKETERPKYRHPLLFFIALPMSLCLGLMFSVFGCILLFIISFISSFKSIMISEEVGNKYYIDSIKERLIYNKDGTEMKFLNSN